MCIDPSTIAECAVSALSVASGIKQAQSDVENLASQAQIARDNAAIETQEGIEEARKIKLQAILDMGDEKTKIASGNIMTSSATALSAIESKKINGDVEALSVLKSSKISAQKYLQQSDTLLEKARLKSQTSILNGIGTALSFSKTFF